MAKPQVGVPALKMTKSGFGIPEHACCANCKDKDDCQLKLQVEIGYKESEKWRKQNEKTHCCLDWKGR